MFREVFQTFMTVFNVVWPVGSHIMRQWRTKDFQRRAINYYYSLESLKVWSFDWKNLDWFIENFKSFHKFWIDEFSKKFCGFFIFIPQTLLWPAQDNVQLIIFNSFPQIDFKLLQRLSFQLLISWSPILGRYVLIYCQWQSVTMKSVFVSLLTNYFPLIDFILLCFSSTEAMINCKD